MYIQYIYKFIRQVNLKKGIYKFIKVKNKIKEK